MIRLINDNDAEENHDDGFDDGGDEGERATKNNCDAHLVRRM